MKSNLDEPRGELLGCTCCSVVLKFESRQGSTGVKEMEREGYIGHREERERERERARLHGLPIMLSGPHLSEDEQG